MNIRNLAERKKRLFEILLFGLTMGLSFSIIFRGQDLPQIVQSVRQLPVGCILASLVTALFFVSAEGVMIAYLLHSLDGKSSLLRCISYSFIGFFYSGITPSATGGQPMQLYYMKKDGNDLADSSVVLMVVALIYKFVLVVIGGFLLVFWNSSLRFYLKGYFRLYLLGLLLNVILVVGLFEVMVVPDVMKKIFLKLRWLFQKSKLVRISDRQQEKAFQFMDRYQGIVQFLKGHKKKIFVVTGLTFLQRCSVFFLTYLIYRGFGLREAGLATVMFLQASVYIAVDMLPVPGAQGITELMYQTVFQLIFPQMYLMPSMYVTRGINFYFLMLVSACIAAGSWICRKKGRSGFRFVLLKRVN